MEEEIKEFKIPCIVSAVLINRLGMSYTEFSIVSWSFTFMNMLAKWLNTAANHHSHLYNIQAHHCNTVVLTLMLPLP